MARPPYLYAIGVGSNRRHGRHGRPPHVVEAAIARLDAEFELFDASSIIITRPVGPGGRDYANAVALIESDCEPPQMLRRLKQMEREFGRKPGLRWGARVVDLDILLWSGGRFRSRKLTIPHRELQKRSFVLQPLSAVAPGWRPAGAVAVRQLAYRLVRRRPSRS